MRTLLRVGEEHPNVAYLYALLGNIMLAVMQIFFKYGERILTSFQIIVFRSVCSILFNLYVLKGVNQ